MNDLDLRTAADDCRETVRATCFEAALRGLTHDEPRAVALLVSLARALEYGVVTPIDEARIVAFEAKLGARLPDDYRQFLLATNGCVPEDNLRVPLASGNGTILQLLYGLDAQDDWMDIESALETMKVRDDGRYPDEALPIGTDGAGNKLVLAIKGDMRGHVFFQNLGAFPERRTDTEWHRTRQFSLIADSFDALFAKLEPRP